MANGQAGETFWTVKYRRVDEGPWIINSNVGGKFPLQGEAVAFMPSVITEREAADPGYSYEVLPVLMACGKEIGE